MTYRRLVWLPAVVPLLLLVAELFMSASLQPVVVRASVECAKLLWLFGALGAAFGFERGDYLRRAWLLIGVAVGLFLLRDASLLLGDAPAWLAVRGCLVIAGNVGEVWGVLLLVRVWNAAGLDDVVRGQRRVLFGVGFALAAVLAGPSIAHDLVAVVSGHADAVPHLASDLGDAIGFVLLAALVRTALALRGGVVFWVWLLLSAGQLSWIAFDGARTVAEIVGVAPTSAVVEWLRVVGASYFCAAGLAQRWVLSARFPVDAALSVPAE